MPLEYVDLFTFQIYDWVVKFSRQYITTNVLSLNPSHDEGVVDTTTWDKA